MLTTLKSFPQEIEKRERKGGWRDKKIVQLLSRIQSGLSATSLGEILTVSDEPWFELVSPGPQIKLTLNKVLTRKDGIHARL